MVGAPKRVDPASLTARDFALLSYENGIKTHYLLLAILAAIVGRPFVGSPPLVVVSVLLALASSTIAFAVLLSGRRVTNGRLRIVMGIFAIAQVASLAAEPLGIPPADFANYLSVLRIVFAVVLLWWAWRLPITGERIILDVRTKP